jgi:hypothetical protein
LIIDHHFIIAKSPTAGKNSATAMRIGVSSCWSGYGKDVKEKFLSTFRGAFLLAIWHVF